MSLLIEALKQAQARKKPKPASESSAQEAASDGAPTAPAENASTSSSTAPKERAKATSASDAPGGLELSLQATEPTVTQAPSSSALELEATEEPSTEPASTPVPSAEQVNPTAQGAPQPPVSTPEPPVAMPSAEATQVAAPPPVAKAAAAAAPIPATPSGAPSGAAPSARAAAQPDPGLRTGMEGNPSPQQTAKALLEAAQSERLVRQRPGASSQRTLMLGGVLAVVVLGLGAGYWYLSQSNASFVPAATQPLPASNLGEDPVPATAETATVLDNDPAALGGETEPGIVEPVKQAVEDVVEGTKVAVAEMLGTDPASAQPETPVAAPAPTPAAFTQPTIGIERRRSDQLILERVEQPGSPLQSAYAALNRGELDQAERLYQQALTRQPRHPDALLGMASIAERRGLTEIAQRRYREVLQSDPGNPIALSSVLAGLQVDQLSGAESELRTALSRYPEHAALYFALGNVLAQRQRWPEAQQAYFEAATRAPSNPDYAFNLAVALDRLAKGELAIRFYRQALQLAESAPAAFAPAAVQRRLTALERQAEGAQP